MEEMRKMRYEGGGEKVQKARNLIYVWRFFRHICCAVVVHCVLLWADGLETSST